MKRIIVTLFALTTFAGTAFAAENGPETISLSAPTAFGGTTVTFHHRQHQERVKQECTKCHATLAGGKIEELHKAKPANMDWAHKTCRGCHTVGIDGKKGPTTNCKECHKK